ncbi:MAG TPA: hypothetical protein VFF52_04895 [Isosphaeraceae bacterium]|nr:hypothetical protein [Isosphaeraceae bacterium]
MIYLHANLKTGRGDEDWSTGIFAIDPATAASVKLSDFEGNVRVSPDGRTLALVRAGRTGANFHADGWGATKLPIPETDEVDDGSPDGDWLVTVSDRHLPHGSGYPAMSSPPCARGS